MRFGTRTSSLNTECNCLARSFWSGAERINPKQKEEGSTAAKYRNETPRMICGKLRSLRTYSLPVQVSLASFAADSCQTYSRVRTRIHVRPLMRNGITVGTYRDSLSLRDFRIARVAATQRHCHISAAKIKFTRILGKSCHLDNRRDE